jgi:NDP-sugar pyrophosphorylase family protein
MIATKTPDAIVLAAGRGERLGNITRNQPKALLTVDGKSLLARHMEALAQSGAQRVVVVVGHFEDLVRRAVGSGSSWGLRVEYVRQSPPPGTGAAILQARHLIATDPFLVLYSDVLLPHEAETLRRMTLDPYPKILGARVEDVSEFGRLVTRQTESGELLCEIIEKSNKSVKGLVNAGAYLLPARILMLLAQQALSPRGELELPESVSTLAKLGTPVRIIEVDRWIDVGTPTLLAEARARPELW